MPNHVTTRCIVTGPPDAIQEFILSHFVIPDDPEEGGRGIYLLDRKDLPEYETIVFDFNTIIPRPGIYDSIPASSVVDLAIEVLSGKPAYHFKHGLAKELRKNSIDMYPGEHASRIQQARDTLTSEELQAGALAIEAFERYGYIDWYDWSIGNWGTKWNSYSFSLGSDQPGHLEFRFDTAWSFPLPVFEALAKRHPRLTFETDSFDEGWNFACTGSGEGGEFTLTSVHPSREMYETVYGSPPDDSDSDEDEDDDYDDDDDTVSKAESEG